VTRNAGARPEAEQVKEEGMSDEIVREFLLESSENLDRLDRELVILEKDPGNRETLSSIFRTIHTIKGTCGFLAFGKLESVAHAGESLLSLLRDGAIGLTPERTTALLSLVDAVRQMLGSIETSGNEGERNDDELVETLKRLQKDNEEKEVKEVNVLVQ
jgi:two-component system chemotaxis sensor kinase CheA